MSTKKTTRLLHLGTPIGYEVDEKTGRKLVHLAGFNVQYVDLDELQAFVKRINAPAARSFLPNQAA